MEAQRAIDAGAAALGLVSKMPSGPGVIDEDRIRQIARLAPPPIATFLLTSLQDASAIIEQVRRCRVNTVQICDRLTSGSHRDIREALPSVKIVQVIHVTGEQSIADAQAVAPHVDAILLDSGRPQATIKELGGTGRRHDWRISRTICERIDKPLFLAGGLNPENVAEAIAVVRPFGVDICSGVRTNNQLDADKLHKFARTVATV